MDDLLPKILRIANNALYFADNSDYGEALYEICVLASGDKDFVADSYIGKEHEI